MTTRKLFVAATRQNDGKTMVSLGLFNAFQTFFKSSAYIKPVGQQYQEIDGIKVDKDAVLFKTIYNLKDPYQLMSPVAIPRGFTESFIENGSTDQLKRSILGASQELTKDKEFLLSEGTGHAGVGSVLGVSNASVAKLIEAKVILVALGGIGRAIDEIMLNKACFDQLGVEISGVIINKVRQDKYDKVTRSVESGLNKLGVNVYGIIPFVEQLTKPTVYRLKEALKAEVLTGADFLSNNVQNIMIGDMIPHHALEQFSQDTLLIVPSDREGLIMTAICADILNMNSEFNVSAIIFTGGRPPKKQIIDMLNRSRTPTLMVDMDSFSVATAINKMLLKLDSNESDKISTIQGLIKDYVDVPRIMEDLM